MTESNGIPEPTRAPPRAAVPRRRSYGWVGFFAVLFVLTVAAVATLWVYNVRQQLTPEKLEQARRLWEKHRPSDYVLTYTKEGSASGTFVVTVRGGEVRSAVMKQQVPESGGQKTKDLPLEKRLWDRYDMAGLFQDLEEFLRIRARPGEGRIFLKATFDPTDGHLEHYVYSDPKTGQRVSVTAELKRTSPAR